MTEIAMLVPVSDARVPIATMPSSIVTVVFHPPSEYTIHSAVVTLHLSHDQRATSPPVILSTVPIFVCVFPSRSTQLK